MPRAHPVVIPMFSTPDGEIRILEFAALPFVPVREFEIDQVRATVVRGGHAHRVCHQLFRCLHGFAILHVWAPGDTAPETYRLDRAQPAIHVPPQRWVELTLGSESATVSVLASHPYEPADYVHDRAAFDALPPAP